MPASQHRIAIVARNVLGKTGTSRTILAHTRLLTASGYSVTIISEKADKQRIIDCGAKWIPIPRIPIGHYFKRKAFSTLVDLAVKWIRPDLVWGHGDNLRSDVLSLHNCTHLAHERIKSAPLSEGSALGRFHGEQIAPQAYKYLIANSRLMRDDVITRFGVDPNKVHVIYPGYDPARFSTLGREEHKATLRRQLAVGPGQLVVGLISSGDFTKRGVAPFLRALALLPAELRDNLVAVVVGKQNNITPYIRLASELGLGHMVRFLPPTPDVHMLYHGLDLLVHAALFEEFGQVVQEAVVCGTPVLASKQVGAMEMVADQKDLSVIDEPYPEMLAKAMEPFLRSPEYRLRWEETAKPCFAPNTDIRNFESTMRLVEAFFLGKDNLVNTKFARSQRLA